MSLEYINVLFFVLLTHLIEGVTQKTNELFEFIFIKFSTFEDRKRENILTIMIMQNWYPNIVKHKSNILYDFFNILKS